MRLPWDLKPRHLVAAAFAVALVLMPLYILSFDPAAKIERLRTPLCRGAIDVNATNQNGSATLLRPDSGIKVNSTRSGAPLAVHLTLLLREPGKGWRVYWELDAPNGREIFYVPTVSPGMEAQV